MALQLNRAWQCDRETRAGDKCDGRRSANREFPQFPHLRPTTGPDANQGRSSRNNQAPWRGVTTFDPLLLATPPCSGHNQYVRKKRAFRKMAALPALLALGLSVAALANVEAAKPIPTSRRPRAASAVKSFGGRTSAWGLRSNQISDQSASHWRPHGRQSTPSQKSSLAGVHQIQMLALPRLVRRRAQDAATGILCCVPVSVV